MLDLDDLLAPNRSNKAAWRALVRIIGDSTFEPALHREVSAKRVWAQAEAGKPDWLWRGIVRTATTKQGVQTYERIVASNFDWSFEAIAGASEPPKLIRKMVGAVKDNNFRATEIIANFEKIRSLDKLRLLQGQIAGLQGALSKISIFNPANKTNATFKGFGPKYARNFWLDMYDVDVSKAHLAIDSRLQVILSWVWPDFGGQEGTALLRGALPVESLYRKIENAMLKLATAAAEQYEHPKENPSWWADRIMFAMLADKKREMYYKDRVVGA